jgi:hypothetical protein
MSENRVLRRIFGSKRQKLVGAQRNLHTEELHKYTSPMTKSRPDGQDMLDTLET